MSDSSQTDPNQEQPAPDQPGSLPPAGQDWRSLRRAERAARRQERRERRASGAYGWVAGAVLILVGAVYLLQNLTGYTYANWWALFILIPAFGAFGSAWNSYQRDGRLTSGGRGALIGGFVLTIIAAAFLFNLDFGNVWPLFLILIGLGILVSAMLPD
jgi:hypothetical protein